jgi:hypothetical protein
MRDDVLARLVGHDERFIEGDPRGLATALLRAPGARMIHENAAHHPSRDGEEVGAVLPGDRFSVDQADIGFVDQGRCLQAVPHALPGHAAPRDLVQLAMDQRNQPLARSLVALSPFEQQCGDIGGVSSNPGILAQAPAARVVLSVRVFTGRSRRRTTTARTMLAWINDLTTLKDNDGRRDEGH